MTLLAGVVDPLPFVLQSDGNISPDADCARVFRPTHGSQTNGLLAEVREPGASLSESRGSNSFSCC